MKLSELETALPWDLPEGAGRELAAFFLDSNLAERDRIRAALLAGSIAVMDDDVADALLRLVADGTAPEDVRAQASIALGPSLEMGHSHGFDDPEDVPVSESMFRRIQDELRIHYRDPEVPKEVRRRVLEASVRAPCDWHKDAVRVAYYSDDPAWRLTAVFAMRYVASFEEQILEALESPDEEIHYEAVAAAGTWEIEAAWPHVRSLMGNPRTPRDLLLVAIEAAGLIGGEEAVELLQDLATSRDEEISAAADEALLFADVDVAWEDYGWEEEEDEES